MVIPDEYFISHFYEKETVSHTFSALLWANIILNAQVFIEMGSPVNPRDAFGSINVYGSDGLVKSIPYNRIKGSPFCMKNGIRVFYMIIGILF